MVNNLNGLYAYLAGNLEGVSDKESSLWRDFVTDELSPLGLKCLNPKIQCFENQVDEDEDSIRWFKNSLKNREFKKVRNFSKLLVRRDLRMVDRADMLIVSLNPDAPTFGTTHEVILASQQRKPILVHIDDVSKFPIWWSAFVNFDLVFTSIIGLVEHLKIIDKQPVKKLNKKYWKIWKDEYK